MAPTTHPVSILAGLQVLVVIAGTFALRLMTTGYEEADPGVVWNTTAIFLRNFGWLVLGVPAIWAIGSLLLERHPEGIWTCWWTIASGLLLLVALSGIFLHLMCHLFVMR